MRTLGILAEIDSIDVENGMARSVVVTFIDFLQCDFSYAGQIALKLKSLLEILSKVSYWK